MKRHRATVALQRVPLPADSGEELFRSASHGRSTVSLGQRHQQSCEFELVPPITEVGEEEITNFKCDRDVAFDVEIIVQIRFRQSDFRAGQKHLAKRSAVL